MLYRIATFAALAFVALSTVGIVKADTPPACNDTPCVVTMNGGGAVTEFKSLAQRLKRTREMLKIDGECYSACTILADLARPYVCVTPKAKMFVHQATLNGIFAGKREPIDYTQDIETWIDKNGGQPTIGWLEIGYRDQLLFWKPCQ